MITGNEDMRGALIEAFLMEKGTKIFYAEAAEKAVKPEIKKTFEKLAKWEEKHMDFIRYLYQSMEGGLEFKSFDDFATKAASPETEAGIPIEELNAKLEKYLYTDEKGALNLALKIEGKAYNHYRNLAEKAADSGAQVIFKEMVEQETMHIQELQKLKAEHFDANEH